MSAIYLEILAKNINIFLEIKHKLPAWLAKESGVKPPNLSKILGRTGNPTLETIIALSNAMGLEPYDLIQPYRNPDEFALTLYFRERNVLKRELVLLEDKYNRSVATNRPITDTHPRRHLNEIEALKGSLSSVEEKIELLRNKIGRHKQSFEQMESTTTQALNRSDIVLKLVSALPSLNEDQLNKLLTLASGYLPTLRDIKKVSN